MFKGPNVFYEESQSSDNEFPYFATKFNARQIMHQKNLLWTKFLGREKPKVTTKVTLQEAPNMFILSRYKINKLTGRLSTSSSRRKTG